MKTIKSAMFIAAGTTLALAGAASAQVVLDGVADEAYGEPIVVQDTQTQFGDSNLGLIDFANGSELDAAYGFIDGDGNLHLLLAGNLESNFNHLELVVDFRDGGQNTLRDDNPDVDFNGLNRLGTLRDAKTGDPIQPGLTFDADMVPDLYMTFACGGDPFGFFGNYAILETEGGGVGEYLGQAGAGAKGALTTEGGFGFAIDNSNVLGVSGGTKLGDGSGVTTGVEIIIPLGNFGYAGGDVKVAAWINGVSHDFLSNQILAGIGGGGNLGEPRDVNFEQIPGSQYFVVSGDGGGTDCEGDLDGNGVVNGADLSILLGDWGGSGDGDIDGNGVVNGADLSILLGAWGECPA